MYKLYSLQISWHSYNAFSSYARFCDPCTFFLRHKDTIFCKTLGTFCNIIQALRSPESMLAVIVYCEWMRHMCTPTLDGGGGRVQNRNFENCYWIMHTLLPINLFFMRVVMPISTGVPRSFAEDCILAALKKKGHESQKRA